MISRDVVRRDISVEHIRIRSERSFAEVRKAMDVLVPMLDPKLIETMSRGDRAAVSEYEKNGPKLFRFFERDHGVILAIAGRARNAIQYEIGNPITASKMTRHQLGASLYAPLRVTLYESEEGGAVFEYDLPSSLFGQFGDERVREVGRYLDRELEAILVKAAH